MKKGFIIMGLAVAVVAAQVTPAKAINKEWSAVAGFVGGVLFANAANCSPRYNQRAVYQQPVQTRVECQPVQQIVYQPVQRTVVYEEPVRTGYYAWRTQRVWVPGSWIYEETSCGTPRKVWYPGYYTSKRHRVWVDTTCETGW